MNMTKIETDTGKIMQQLKDMAVWVKDIQTQTRITNGSVARNSKELALITLKQLECPARIYHTLPNIDKEKETHWKKMTILISILTALIMLAGNFILNHLEG